MKQNLFNKLWLRVGMIVAIMTTALSGTAWAETWTHAFASPEAISNNSITVDGATWNVSTVTKTGSPTIDKGNSYQKYCLKFGTGKNNCYSSITFSTDYFSNYNVQSVSINVLHNASKSGTFTATQGNTTIGTITQTIGTSWTDLTVNTNEGSGGTLSFTYSPTDCAVNIHSITVTYTTGGGSQTETCAAPTFSPAAGAYTSAQNVTISTETSGATIYYTTNGDDPTTSSNVYSTPISVSSTTTIKAMAVASGYNNSSVATATYTIVSLDHAGTEADPYTVADAITLLTAAPSATFEDVYVSGIISQVDSYNSTYKSITYWISDDGTTTDQFEVYSGKGLNGADFSSKDDLIVGSAVTVKGKIKKYNSTFEFDVNSQIVSLVEPTYPIINVENATLNLTYDATSGEIEYTITNATSATLTATSSASWISNITVGEESVTFTTTANNGTTDREATITLSYTGAEDVTVTVTQGHYVAEFATLPFSFDGGKEDIENTAGLTETGLGTDYKNSPYLKLDGTGDYVLLKINERPGVLTFDIKGNGAGSEPWAGTFKVQASADGETYSDVATYTTLGTETKTINNLGENVRYIKWIYTEKSSGNVALGNIVLDAYVEPTGNTVTIGTQTNVASVEMWYFDSDIVNIVDGAEVEEGVEVFVQPIVEDGYEVESVTVVDASNNSINVSENNGAWSFYMPNSSVTISITAVQSVTPPTPVTGDKYVKVTSTADLTDGQYLIVYEGGSVAFNGGLETLDAANNTISVTISGNEIAANETTEAAEVTIAAMGSGYSICSASGLYIYHSGTKNTLNTSEEAQANAITFNDGNVLITVGEYSMYFNSATDQQRFRYFKNAQQDIQLYKFVEATTPEPYAPETRTLNGQGYATFASTSAVDFDNTTGCTAWAVTEVDGTSITFTQVTGTVEAGTGVLLKGDPNGTVTFSYSESTGSAVSGNLLVGITSATPIEGSEGAYEYYGLNGKSFVPLTTGTVQAGRALLPADVVTAGVKAFTFNFDDDATGISTVETFAEEGAIYNLAGQRISKMQKGINIVNGKKILK